MLIYLQSCTQGKLTLTRGKEGAGASSPLVGKQVLVISLTSTCSHIARHCLLLRKLFFQDVHLNQPESLQNSLATSLEPIVVSSK